MMLVPLAKPGGILALDIATVTGWAYGYPGEHPLWGAQRMGRPGDEAGAVFAFFRSWLAALIDAHQPAVLVFESPYMPRARPPRRMRSATTGQVIFADPDTHAPNMHTIRRLVTLCGIAEMIGAERKLVTREQDTATIAKTFTGSGRGKRVEKKERVMATCHLYGWQPATFDEADALAIFATAEAILFPMVHRGAGRLFAAAG